MPLFFIKLPSPRYFNAVVNKQTDMDSKRTWKANGFCCCCLLLLFICFCLFFFSRRDSLLFSCSFGGFYTVFWRSRPSLRDTCSDGRQHLQKPVKLWLCWCRVLCRTGASLLGSGDRSQGWGWAVVQGSVISPFTPEAAFMPLYSWPKNLSLAKWSPSAPMMTDQRQTPFFGRVSSVLCVYHSAVPKGQDRETS